LTKADIPEVCAKVQLPLITQLFRENYTAQSFIFAQILKTLRVRTKFVYSLKLFDTFIENL